MPSIQVAATSNSRAEDGLTIVGQLAEEPHDSPCGLRVKTRRRLIQEQEKLGLYHHQQLAWVSDKITNLSSELDSNSRAFAVLDTQRSDNGITIVLKATHLQTLVNAVRISINLMVKGAVTTYYASSSAEETVWGWRR
jgi:hypothetical protein